MAWLRPWFALLIPFTAVACEAISGVGDLKVSGAGGGASVGPGSGGSGQGAHHGASNGGTGGTMGPGAGASGPGVGGAGPGSGGAQAVSSSGISSSGAGAGPAASSSSGMPVCMCGDGFCNPQCNENAQTCPQDCGSMQVSSSSGQTASSSTGMMMLGIPCGMVFCTTWCCGVTEGPPTGCADQCPSADKFKAHCATAANCPSGQECCADDTNGNMTDDDIRCADSGTCGGHVLCASDNDCSGTRHCLSADEIPVPGYKRCR